jgi:tripartite-type tricarboxylate transporter receptor subunit TctC
VKTVRELVTLAKARPGALTYGSPGNGSQAHVGVELLKMMTGIDMTHVPYNGVGPAIRELLGGQTSLALGQTPAVLPHIQSGRLRAVAAASAKRLAIQPDLPTVAESNLAGFEAVSWYALMAPAETPKEIVARLSAEITRVVRLQDVRERLNGLGAEPVGGTPDELAATMRSESSRWAKVIKTAGIKAD